MQFYMGLALSFFVFALYSSSRESRIGTAALALDKVAFFAFAALTIALSGLRWERGTDWTPYYNFFEKNTTWAQFSNIYFEILYKTLNFVIKQFSDSYTVFLFIEALIVIVLPYRAIKKIALYPALTYYLFFCSGIGNMFPVRQTIANAIAIASIYFIHTRQKWKFIILTLIASGFHNSLLIWFIAYPVYHKKISGAAIVFLFFAATAVGLLGKRIIEPLVRLTIVNTGLSGTVLGRLAHYAMGNYSDGAYSLAKVAAALLKRAMFVPFFLLFRARLAKTHACLYGVINLFMIGNIFYMLFAFNEAFGPLQRMSTVFLFSETLILPAFLAITKAAWAKYLVLFVLLIYGLLKLYVALTGYPEAYMPYRSVLSF